MSNTYKDATLLKALATIAILSTNLSAANFMPDDLENKEISAKQNTGLYLDFELSPNDNYTFKTADGKDLQQSIPGIGIIEKLPELQSALDFLMVAKPARYRYTPDISIPNSSPFHKVSITYSNSKEQTKNLTLTIFAKPEFSKDLVIPTIVGKPHRLPFEKPVNLPADVKQSVVVTAPDSKFGTFSHTEDAFTFTPSEELINANAILKYHINCGDNYGDTDPITITFKYHESSLSLTRAAYSFVIAPIFNAIGLTLEKTKDYTMQSGVWKKFSGLFGR